MHSLLHADHVRANGADLSRGHAGRAVRRSLRPKAPPGRLRPLVAHVLGALAGRVDRDVARRAVA